MSRRRNDRPVTRRAFRRWQLAEERRWNRRMTDILNAVIILLDEDKKQRIIVRPGATIVAAVEDVAREMLQRNDDHRH